ncbi:AF4/FMR2 family member 4-like isoform X2 [Mastomys coucha]|uniref:AF4/FMR2 family member 4-like isoform X2 n=1 Tax=Mastomys coucha TaxID=35658 RepID=UPI0012617124|nr:AF4/FMR2 family member 4-like isoform X2 [Mastomys coucha]
MHPTSELHPEAPYLHEISRTLKLDTAGNCFSRWPLEVASKGQENWKKEGRLGGALPPTSCQSHKCLQDNSRLCQADYNKHHQQHQQQQQQQQHHHHHQQQQQQQEQQQHNNNRKELEKAVISFLFDIISHG